MSAVAAAPVSAVAERRDPDGPGALGRFDWVALLTALAVAALLRLPGIDGRGRFDADQGHDMLTLLAFARDGVIPLLGPKTSAGDFHHGAMYYFLLAPAAAISNADPVVVTIFLALLGIGAVALTWWLGRAIGGPRAGAIAGLLLAVSPAAIDESTFIWNPNPIAFFAALAFAAAWRARSGGRRTWWAVAIAAAGMVVQLHVLGAIFFLELLEIAVLEVRRDRSVLRPLLAGLAVVTLLFVPLLASELGSGFAETRGILAYFSGGAGARDTNPIFAIAFTLYRVVGWPFVGSVLDAPVAAAVLLAVTIAGAVLALRLVRSPQRTAIRWFIGLVIWSTLALALAAPSLLHIVIGLPNDHYHAFLDPVVILLVAVPLGILFDRAVEAWRSTRRGTSALATAAVGLAIVAIFAISIARRPPAVDPDGGWPALRSAGERLVEDGGDGATFVVVGLPTFKLPDAITFPIVHAGGDLLPAFPGYSGTGPVPQTNLVVVCDRLFEGPIGAACGGPAEDAWVTGSTSPTGGMPFTLKERFDASPRTVVSVYVLDRAR
jgi:4-amino-4-deoxy-L-arabinose transferase-like glycosyltransferase